MWAVKSIPVDDVPTLWHVVAPMLAGAVALSEGRYNMRSVFDGLQKRIALLWVVYDDDLVIRAAFTAAKRRYPQSAWLCVEFMGGDGMNDWIEEVVRTLTSFAKDSGLVGLEMVGRKGWTRVLAASGWRENAVMLVKRFEDKAV
jgi:hypothetical protein